MDPAVTAALVAGIVSLAGAVLSHRATLSTARQEIDQARFEIQQTQFGDVIKKRIETYPELWRIHIHYETNWVYSRKPKTREWAEDYLAELNAFNLKGGLFFSQALYEAFFRLRQALYDAIEHTDPGGTVTDERTALIRRIVYGHDGQPGLSTHLKDELGSYSPVALQARLP